MMSAERRDRFSDEDGDRGPIRRVQWVGTCATCATRAPITHVSPLGEYICQTCGEAEDWIADGMDPPRRVTDADKIEALRNGLSKAFPWPSSVARGGER